MKSLWDDREAARFAQSSGELGLRVYTSRLLGRDPSLVLHGGGNTSVKIRERNLLGQEEDVLYVKGTGWDLATIEEAGFAPVRVDPLLSLARLPSLSDPQMVNELKTRMTHAAAPAPSVETLLHAILPHRYVDHTHADAVVTVTNTEEGRERIREIYGESVVVVPYVMPGFDLARAVAERFPEEAGENTVGIVLMHHGVFSFGETAKESYERMIDLVERAERYLAERGAWGLPPPEDPPSGARLRADLAALRKEVSSAAGFPVILSLRGGSRGRAFARRQDAGEISQQGPATPDHILRTKRLPMLGRDVGAYRRAYEAYFAAHARRARERKIMLDSAPRVILDPELGLCTAGRTAREADIAADLYEHTIEVVLRATALGGYRALPAQDLFDVEYWDLEQAKLRKGGPPPAFAGEVALVTGAASGIGKACVDSLLRRGAAVVGLDVNPAVEALHGGPDYLGVAGDVTDEPAVREGLERGVRRFGGLDILILNAGVFAQSRPVAELSTEEWRRVMGVNLDANAALLRECHPLLRLSPKGGRVVVIGSKNVPAPGPGAAAYSASKAALTQLMRVAALEWGGDGIRVNAIHPDAVFDTGIWTREVLESRAASYGLSVEAYKRKNVLKVEVTSRDVAELAAEMCGPLFAKTTGAQVPVDGGNDRVI
ncbi:MAG: bifunctional aldolase/short-chain dehydrogenase [Candidatus Tectomicrobia bacterium]|nr:bifunctional aldolase/short-chain dehydrogenase [Candidatus Tectomicrobia bacterium]